jgi:hypothetical protein
MFSFFNSDKHKYTGLSEKHRTCPIYGRTHWIILYRVSQRSTEPRVFIEYPLENVRGELAIFLAKLEVHWRHILEMYN